MIEKRLLKAIAAFEKLKYPTSKMIQAVGKSPDKWGQAELDYFLRIYPTAKWRADTPFYDNIVIDGNWLAHKSYQSTDDDSPWGTFIRNMIWLKETYRCDRITFCWDSPSSREARQKISPEYKGNREEKPEALKQYLGELQEFVAQLGAYACSMDGYEGDDCIASLAFSRGDDEKILIYSTDKDLFQLVSDDVHFHRSTPTEEKLHKGNDAKITIKSVQFSVEEFTYAQALMGDGTDNISGVPGIGAAKARLLLDICPEWIKLVCTKQEVSKEIQGMLDEKKSDKLIQKLLQNSDKAALSFEQVVLYGDISPTVTNPAGIDKDALYTTFSTRHIDGLYGKISKLRFLSGLK